MHSKNKYPASNNIPADFRNIRNPGQSGIRRTPSTDINFSGELLVCTNSELKSPIRWPIDVCETSALRIEPTVDVCGGNSAINCDVDGVASVCNVCKVKSCGCGVVANDFVKILVRDIADRPRNGFCKWTADGEDDVIWIWTVLCRRDENAGRHEQISGNKEVLVIAHIAAIHRDGIFEVWNMQRR